MRAEGGVCDVCIVGDDGGDLVADESNAVGGRKDRLIDIQVAGALVRNIVAGEDAMDAGQGEGTGGIDIEDARVGDGGAEVLEPEGVGWRDIKGVAGAARDLVRPINGAD